MTDYIYSFSLHFQTRLYLLSLGLGFFAGIVYDAFRAIRICFGNGKISYFITDILYLVSLGFLNFIFFLSFNEGEIRAFALFGEGLGFTVYYFGIGTATLHFFEKATGTIRQILTAVFNFLAKPPRKFFAFICKIVKKHLKLPQKNENKSKYPLKVNRHLLYNLTDRKQKAKKSERKE